MLDNILTLKDKLAEKLSSWEGIHCILINEDLEELDIYDPYYRLSLNVYFSVSIPSKTFRQQICEDLNLQVGAVSSRRLFAYLDEIPVNIHCIDSRRINYLVKNLGDPNWLFHEKGSFIFHRLYHNIIAYDDKLWYKEVSEHLEHVPDLLWKNIRAWAVGDMLHNLKDFEIAISKEDQFYAFDCLAKYLDSLIKAIFAINSTIEPERYNFGSKVCSLAELPTNFIAFYEQLLSGSVGLEKKRAMAFQLARSVTEM